MRDHAVVGSDAADAGLTSAQVAERVAAGQANDVPARAGRSVADIVRGNVLTRFNAIIGALFVVILVIGPIQDGLFGLVVIINTGIGIIQELRAKRTLEKLAIIGEARCRVRRDGRVVELAPNEIVLDDVIELGPGDKVVVDGTVTETAAMEIDESLLTGEADPIHKRAGDGVMSGSFAVAGTGAYRATRVGREAYAAQLAEEASKFTLVRSELRNGINRILTIVTWLFVPAGAITIYTQLRVNDQLPDALRSTVAALSAMVPEGLVLLTSIAFALGVIRLGRRRCLVQELPAIEGLARVDVVCADKTGTLTEDGMRLSGVRPVAETPAPETVLAALATTDPRPNASLRAIAEAYPRDPGWTATAVAPFSSARKWSGATFAGHGSWVLGAPDVLLPEGGAILAQAVEVGAGGLRVLLLGRVSDAVDAPGAPGEVAPVALVVLEQRVRGDAAETLRYFRSQNVDVRVISGDNAVSVGAVAASLGLPNATHPVDARELPEDRAALAARMDDATVFGRVTPAQKRAMVAALQSRGHTVAMTGDGVNDVLALKDADIGVAMGSGSPATRAVAQIVLLDDRFATLPHVVAEGRRVIGNIERVAKLFLTKTVYSVTLAFIIGLASLPFPFLPRHLTLVGGLTIGIPAFFLALAPNLERARTGFVARVLRISVPAGVIAAAASAVAYVVTRADPASTQLQDQTAAVIALFGVSWWVLAITARPWLAWRVGLVALMALAFVVVMSVGLGRWFFALDPGSVTNDLVAVGVAAVGAALVELAWWVNGRMRREPQAGERPTLPAAR